MLLLPTCSPGGRLLRLLALVVPGLLSAPSPAAAQEPMEHGTHAMADDSAGWRMPPMPNMPMIPGLEGKVPVVGPLLPGSGMDLSTLPEARPSEPVEIIRGDTLELAVSMVRRTLRGRDYAMYGYNGQYPGPFIRALRGATVVVRVTNRIRMPTTVHWHGVRLENRFDGVPGLTQEPIAYGESFTYEVRVPDDGMFWYHPHAREDVQQDLGLYGNLLVVPRDSTAYGPVHREELFVLDDILVDERGFIPWGEEAPTHALMGRFGTLMLVNGSPDHALEVRRGEVVRFWMTNVANARTFNVRFPGGRVKVVGSDVGRFERETWSPSVVIAPAERYVVEARFTEPGTHAITNSIQAVNHFRGEFYPHVDTLALVTVTDGEAEPDLSEAWETLRENPGVTADIERYREHFDREPDHELVTTVRVRDLPLPIVRSMEIDTLYVPPIEWNDAMPMMNWLSTGEQVEWILRERETGAENEEIDWSFRTGDVVRIRIFNDTASFHPMNHPIHVHGQRFLVVARDGIPADNLVWKDTAILPVGSTMDILVEMSNPGAWMLHCHISEHLHSGMKLTFQVEGEAMLSAEGSGGSGG